MDCVVLAEDFAHEQMVRPFVDQSWMGGRRQEVACGSRIGAKRIFILDPAGSPAQARRRFLFSGPQRSSLKTIGQRRPARKMEEWMR